ncbi:hypothetical protein GOV13_01190 [Candidatus Pacearchaeota archaeon]|nr:hypothetical protein [Candidatus Pacearchaeota archaeon]
MLIDNEIKIKCIHCSSKDFKPIQLRKNKTTLKQIYLCKKCCRRFTLDDGFKKFRHPPLVIKTALRLFEKGYSLSQITYNISQNYNIKVSRKTILDWKRRFLKEGG